MTISTPVSDKDLQKAIELRISECYGAMSIANALGGSRSIPWDLARNHRLPELVADALDRGLDLKSFRASVDETPFMDCKSYMRIREEIGGHANFPKCSTIQSTE